MPKAKNEPAAPAPAPAAEPQVINVVPGDAPPISAPRPGSARERLSRSLEKIAAGTGVEPEPQPSPPPVVKPVKTTQVPAPAEPAEPPAEPAEPAGPAEPAEPGEPGGPEPPAKGKKQSPWKLVDDYKKRAAEAEKRLEELSRNQPSPEEMERRQKEARAKEDRLAELEKEIRYANWRKSPDYIERFQKPYEAAWEKAMGELSEIPVTNEETGETRPMNAADLLELVNMPLARARAAAKQLFGDFEDDVMTHRKAIRDLADNMTAAEQQFQKEGAEREKKMAAEFQASRDRVIKEVSEVWTRSNEEILKHDKLGRFFKAADGDDEASERLRRGFELADQAMRENPFNPNLTAEQRPQIVKSQASLRNRAAAFGHLVLMVERLEKQLAEREAKIAQYEGSAPEAGGSTPPAAAPAPASARDRMYQRLQKLAT